MLDWALGHRFVTLAASTALLALATLLGGCISTEETVFTNAASPEETLKKRVQLARKYIGAGDWGTPNAISSWPTK